MFVPTPIDTPINSGSYRFSRGPIFLSKMACERVIAPSQKEKETLLSPELTKFSSRVSIAIAKKIMQRRWITAKRVI